MEYTELDLAKQELKEENHLLNIYKEKQYRGWYKYIFITPVENSPGQFFKDIIIRFRLPPALPLYSEAIRNFSLDERLMGIHRFLIGMDLQEKTKEMLKYNTLNEYVKKLSDEDVSDFLNRMKDLVTFDCNAVPYLHIRKVINVDESKEITSDSEEIIKKHIFASPDYLSIFIQVLNRKITISEAKELSKNIIFNETMELSL